jgi:hypothetical protein
VRRPLVLLLVVGVLAVPATAPAAPVVDPPPPAGYGVAIDQQSIDGAGDPVVRAFVEDRSATVTWHACAPECGGPIGVVSDDGRATYGSSYVTAGPTAAGTSFEVRATANGTTRTARTTPWGGPAAVAVPPSLAGDARIGRVVRAVPGTWSGGWDTDFDIAEVRACPTADGASGCVGLGPSPLNGPQQDVATIDPAYAGWFIGAVTTRAAHGQFNGGLPVLAYDTFGTRSSRPAPAPGLPRTAFGPLVGPIPAARVGDPPTVSGKLGTGVRVTALPGTWPDAPDDGVRATGLRACPTRQDGDRCRVLAAAGGTSLTADSRGTATLGTDLLGWYVGAFERRGRTSGNVAAPFSPGSPGFDRPPVPGPGMVLGPLSAAPVRLGFAPRIALTATPRVTGGRLVVGRIRCAARCVVLLRVTGRGRSVTRRTVVRGSASLSVSARRLPRDVRRVRSTVRIEHATTHAARVARVR